MIEQLVVSRAAYFYKRKKRITNAAIAGLFRTLRLNARTPSTNLFKVVRAELDGSRFSGLCFSFERQPSFLSDEAGVTERIYGFVLLVERGDLVAVLKSGFDLPSSFRSDFFVKIQGDRVEGAIARSDAIFQKLRLKNMSTSKFALQFKSLEGQDLENAVATSSASRFVPQGYSVLRDDGQYSATPNTGRISIHADRARYEQVVRWAGEVMDLLVSDIGETSTFIRNFARPVDLASIAGTVSPTYLAIDVSNLRDTLFSEERSIRLVREVGNNIVELLQTEIDPILQDLDQNFEIVSDAIGYHAVHPEEATRIGTVRVGKARISLLNFTPPSTAGVFVESAALPAGTDPDRKPFSRYIDRESLFTVLFSDLALAYIDGSLYRDQALLGGGTNFLRHLQAEPLLATTTSEKGAFADGQRVFDDTSVFRTIVDRIARDADVLLCDDLGDEWADFIGISTETRPSMISFYHAKHGDISLGASPFHDSVGQAMKNLGRMSLAGESMETKYTSWETNYRGSGAVTEIPRIIRGGGREEVEEKITEVHNAPDLVKRVFIVTSSLSRAQVAAAFDSAARGVAPSAHFVQLYWLLMSYFSACAEIGTIGYVVCQP